MENQSCHELALEREKNHLLVTAFIEEQCTHPKCRQFNILVLGVILVVVLVVVLVAVLVVVVLLVVLVVVVLVVVVVAVAVVVVAVVGVVVDNSTVVVVLGSIVAAVGNLVEHDQAPIDNLHILAPPCDACDVMRGPLWL